MGGRKAAESKAGKRREATVALKHLAVLSEVAFYILGKGFPVRKLHLFHARSQVEWERSGTQKEGAEEASTLAGGCDDQGWKLSLPSHPTHLLLHKPQGQSPRGGKEAPLLLTGGSFCSCPELGKQQLAVRTLDKNAFLSQHTDRPNHSFNWETLTISDQAKFNKGLA